MIDLGLNQDNDLDFENDLSLVEDGQEVKQSLEVILRTRKGEFFADPEMGLEQSSLLGKRYNKEIAATDIFEAIEQDGRVSDAQIVSMIQTGRSLDIEIKARSETEMIETEVNLE